MFFINQVPYIQPKTENTNLWESLEINERREIPWENLSNYPSKKLSYSEGNNRTMEGNN